MRDSAELARSSEVELRTTEHPLWQSFDDSHRSSVIDNRADHKEHSNKRPPWWHLGLWQDDATAQTRARRCVGCCACTLTSCAVFLPLLFLVFIPMYVQSTVNSSSMSLIEAHIIYPTSEGFQSNVKLKLQSVGSVPIDIQSQSLTLTWPEPGGGKMVKLGKSNTVHVESGSPISLRAHATVLNSTAMSNFNTYTMGAETVQWKLHGQAKITVSNFIATTAHLSKHVILDGFNNFSVPPVILSVNTTQGTDMYLYNNISTLITSQSSIAVDFGQNLYYQLFFNDTQVGFGYLPDASFAVGQFQAYGVIQLFSNLTGTAEQYEAAMVLQSQYISGFPSDLSLRNFYLANATNVSWMVKPLGTMQMETTLQPLGTSLIQLVNMHIDLDQPVLTPFELVIQNVLACTLYIDTIQGFTFYQGDVISYVDILDANITVPPQSTITTQTFYSEAENSVPGLILELVNDPNATVNMSVTQTGYMDAYPVSLALEFIDVPANVSCVPENLCNI